VEKSCVSCGSEFEITDADMEFYDRVSPVFNDKKYQIDPPKHCPNCRFRRRLMFRNDRHFYNRKSDSSGKDIITFYSPDKPYKVFDRDEWWADTWNPQDFGRDVDFSRPFLEQFQELRLEVPRVCLIQSNTENSNYTNHALNMKNCYLVWGGGECEDCYYSNYIVDSKDTVDSLSLYSCERCYEGIASERCYDCISFMNCNDCKSCISCEDCLSCEYCIGCFGLHRKKYCLFNQEVGKDEWEKKRKELGSLNAEKIELLNNHLKEIKKDLPHRCSHIYGSENCTGDNIYSSENCYNCYDIKGCEDCKYTGFTPTATDVYDSNFAAPVGLELSYFNNSTLGKHRLLFNFFVYYCNNVYYSMECHYSEHLFGCASMRHNEYCILNKQYSKDEYEKMASKLADHMKETGEWGDYFPTSCAPICYNESNAQDYFPITKQQAESENLWWHDHEEVKEEGEILEEVPSTIEEIDESICEKALKCEVTGKQYKILPQELRFYKTMGLAIPKKHVHQRHRERLDKRNPRWFWKRECPKCGEEMVTNYSVDNDTNVICEACYLKEAY
jgi:hypothetical protein|tara:strand:- start:475 stop:2148 length:1674 start_codon:yes stop_codon:yes gene_type:complete